MAKETTEAKEVKETKETKVEKKEKKAAAVFKVVAGPFKERAKALKQAALVKKIVANSVIEINGTKYIINIKSFDNKNDANAFKKDMVAKGIEATVIKN